MSKGKQQLQGGTGVYHPLRSGVVGLTPLPRLQGMGTASYSVGRPHPLQTRPFRQPHHPCPLRPLRGRTPFPLLYLQFSMKGNM